MNWNSPGSFTTRLVTGMLLLNCVVFGLAAFNIHQDKLKHDQRARITAENLSLLLEHDISAVFDRIDLSLKAVAQRLEERIAAGTLQKAWFDAYLKQQRSYLPEVISLRVADAQGIVRYGDGVRADTVINVSDREHFMRQRDTADEGLVIAKPVKTRIDQEWAILVSRRLNRPNGEFAGIVYVILPVAYFATQFSSLKLGSHGVVVLRTADHISMARYPEAPAGFGVGQFGLSEQLAQLLKDNPSRVTYVSSSPWDGIERTISYAKSASYPLHVVVGLATQDYLSEWKWDTARTVGVLILFGAISFLFSLLLSRSWRRQLTSDEALSASEERFHLLFKHSPIGISLVNQDHRFLDVNEAFCHLMGYTVEELRDKTFLDITHPDSREADLASSNAILTGAIPQYSIEKRYLHKDGHVIWAQVFAVAIPNQQGKILYRLAMVEDITERRAAERVRTEHLEHQRDILVREVHHRIKNNLQGVISLIEQLMLKYPAAAQALEEAAGQIGAIAAVHGLQGQTLASEVRPRQLIRVIVDSISRLSSTVIECEEFDGCNKGGECEECEEFSNQEWRLNERDTVAIAMVVNELIYNAVKHTPAGPAASVAVRFGKQPGFFSIRVINRPATLPANFDWAKAAGLGTGLTLLASLLPGQGAKLMIEQQGDAVEAHLQLSHPCLSVPPIS